MKPPLVSVYITAYNQEVFIEQAILSAVTQDHTNLEVVVSDDASTDRTPQIIQDLAKKFPDRLRVFYNQANLGIVENHRIALGHCRGNYIASLDGDDSFLPGKISQQVEFMVLNPECVISYHDCEVVDEEGQFLYQWVERFGKKTGGSEVLARYGLFMCSPTVMARKEFVRMEEYGKYTTSGADWFFWLQTLEYGKGRIGFLDRSLARYRRHGSNITLNWREKLDSRLLTLNQIENRFPHLRSSVRQYRSDLFLMNAIKNFSKGEHKTAGKMLLDSVLQAAPYFWNIIRLPLREIFFLIKNSLQWDDLVVSLFSSE